MRYPGITNGAVARGRGRALALSLALTMSTPALAQTQCGEYSPMVEHIIGDYGESLRSWGVRNGSLIEVWANPETGSFTIIRHFVQQGQHIGCVLTAGEAYREFQPEEGESL